MPVSVPPVHDTTPCMDYMLAYEECIVDAAPRHAEVFHPNWPTLWPRLLTDGRLRPDLIDDPEAHKGPRLSKSYRWNTPIEEGVKEKLWECEEERFLYKACLRKVIRLNQDKRSRFPVFQPEENVYKGMRRRLYIHPENRYPSDTYSCEKDDDSMHMRWRWPKFVENEDESL